MLIYDMIYDIIHLTEIGFTPGGSSTVHICAETIRRTQSTQTVTFLGNRAVYDLMWKNTVQSGRPCLACCIPKAINTISVYVTPIAFLLQQWLHERA